MHLDAIQETSADDTATFPNSVQRHVYRQNPTKYSMSETLAQKFSRTLGEKEDEKLPGNGTQIKSPVVGLSCSSDEVHALSI